MMHVLVSDGVRCLPADWEKDACNFMQKTDRLLRRSFAT